MHTSHGFVEIMRAMRWLLVTTAAIAASPTFDSNEASHAVTFLPSTFNAGNLSIVLQETGVTLIDDEKVTFLPEDFFLRGANLTGRKFLFNITRPLLDGQGRLERVDRPGEPVHTFTLEDLNAKSITLTAPTEKAIGKLVDAQGVNYSFAYQVIDELSQRDDYLSERTFYIRVLSSNMEAPTFPEKVVNITVRRGQSVPIAPAHLAISDDTSLDDITIRLTVAPRGGRLMSLVDGLTVQIQEGTDEPHANFASKAFRYEHDGRNIEDDWAEIQATDGKHQGMLRINVKVTEV